MAINQYREKVEVIVNNINVQSTEQNEVLLKTEVIVTNTSQSTTSLIETSIFLDGKIIGAESNTGLQLTLISGHAEKVDVQFRITLTVEQLASKGLIYTG